MAVQTLHVDQTRTFQSVRLLTVEPKTEMGSTEQARNKEGVPQWQAHLLVTVNAFGKPAKELVKCSMAAHSNPGDGIDELTPVELIDLQAGFMNGREGSKATVWFRCSALRSTAATGRKGSE